MTSHECKITDLEHDTTDLDEELLTLDIMFLALNNCWHLIQHNWTWTQDIVSSNIVLLTFNRGSLILNTTQLTIIFDEANISRMNIRESTDLQHKITDIEQKTFLNLNKIVIVLEKLALNTELTTVLRLCRLPTKVSPLVFFTFVSKSYLDGVKFRRLRVCKNKYWLVSASMNYRGSFMITWLHRCWYFVLVVIRPSHLRRAIFGLPKWPALMDCRGATYGPPIYAPNRRRHATLL